MTWKDIKGPFNQGAVEAVQAICEKIKNGTVIELGCLRGRSTFAMAEVCSKHGTRIVTIDNFAGGEAADGSTKAQQQEDIKTQFLENRTACGFDSTVSLIHGDSSESASSFSDESVDFCFIDADHRPESLQRDIEAWWPKVKRGGQLGGHDWPGSAQRIRKVVESFARMKETTAEELSGSCWLLNKPKVVL